MPTKVVKNGGVEICTGGERLLMGENVAFKDDEQQQKGISCSDESSSSIGKNSDDLSRNSMDKSENGEEVQSSYKDAMEALEEVLPIRVEDQIEGQESLTKSEMPKCRKGISRFYTGKSKSFTSLADASSSSSKHISKPEDPYSRRRRNLLSYSLIWEKNRLSCLRSNGGGISKRVTTSNRTKKLALAVAVSNSGSSKKQADGCNSSTGSLFVSSPIKDFSSWRSFSLADLQQCTNPDQ